MEFKTRFEANRNYAVSTSDELGLDDVDRIRIKLGVPQLALERIYHRKLNLADNPTLHTPEEVARAAGHFRDRQSLIVRCKEHQLDKYVNERVDATRNKENGEVTHAEIVPYVNEAAVFDAWATAGYPLEWGAEE